MTLRLAIIVALCCLGSSATSLADAGPERLLPTATAQSIHAQGDYPDSLSLTPEPEPPPDWLQQLMRAIGDFFAAVGPFVRWLAYVLLAVGALYLVARLIRHVSDQKDATDTPVLQPVVETRRVGALQIPGDDPDSLAAEGKFDRAIYILLLRALRQAGWGSAPGDASRTAREVARSVAEADRRHPPLRDLVALAEPVRFGGVIAEAQLYERARRHYLDLCEAA